MNKLIYKIIIGNTTYEVECYSVETNDLTRQVKFKDVDGTTLFACNTSVTYYLNEDGLVKRHKNNLNKDNY